MYQFHVTHYAIISSLTCELIWLFNSALQYVYPEFAMPLFGYFFLSYEDYCESDCQWCSESWRSGRWWIVDVGSSVLPVYRLHSCVQQPACSSKPCQRCSPARQGITLSWMWWIIYVAFRTIETSTTWPVPRMACLCRKVWQFWWNPESIVDSSGRVSVVADGV